MYLHRSFKPAAAVPAPASVPPPPPPPAPGRAADAAAAPANFPVYLVEPDRELRIALVRALAGAGFTARPFADPRDLAAALPELAPGCVVVDIAELGGTHAAALSGSDGEGRLRFPTILTFAALSPADAVAAVRFGAADLLSRPIDLVELLAALRRVAPRVRRLERRQPAEQAKGILDGLTVRQREILDCIMRGLPTKKIARILDLSPRTVEMHRGRLHRRLAVGSVAELLALAWQAQSSDSG